MKRGQPTQLILVSLVLLAAACSGGDGPDLETSSSPTASPTSSTAAPSSSTSTTATTTSTTDADPRATDAAGQERAAVDEPPSGRTSYVVAPGDGLAAIAQAHGVSLDNLIAANGIADPNQIEVGQELVIPAPGETFGTPSPPAQQLPPPGAPPPESTPVVNGGDLYFNHCSGCHGDSGEGAAGPALGGGAVVAKYPNPADQIALVTNGGMAMPAYGSIISAAEIEAVVRYTRSL